MKLVKNNRGQATVMTVIFLVVLCGMVALVLDVGSWYRAQRALQAEADAAALAGAQALPDSTSDASNLAVQYADKNGGGLTAAGISFTSDVNTNDTIHVKMTKPAPGFFSNLFGLSSVTVGAHAAARSDQAEEALYVAPITVNIKHPMLSGPTCHPLPCQDPTEIDLADLHKPGSGSAAGSFGLINLNNGDSTGSVGAQDLGNWITQGFNQYLPLGNYYAVPSTKWNSSWVTNAMQIRTGTTLLFPVYDTITGPGDNAVFHVIAWVGFYVTGFNSTGSSGAVYGHFTRMIVQGIQAKSGDDVPDLGTRVIQLVD